MNRRIALVFILALLVVASSLTTAFSADPSPHKRLKRDCEVCHTTASFRDVQFDHATTDFPLENRHQLEGCRTCHNLEDFSGTSSECSACHTDVHESRLGFDCNRCHQSRGWSVFDVETIHLETNFPILGRHAMVDCQSCHQGMPQSDMSFNTTRCVGCHQSEYLSVSSPNHVTAGFSTECMDCHQMNGWKPAMMDNHDVFFPIFSGEHRGSWNDCSTCHTQDNTFQVFTCLVCHEHAQTKMDGGHQGILGYAYSSPDCYFCHPSGKAGEFTDHDAQFFPIFSGAHQSAWADCSVCHPNPTNRRDIDCLNCHQHSQLVMDGAHGSMAGYSYTSTACLSCHPSSERGSFLAHDGEFFPIFSGTHQGSWADCTACHSLATDRGTFDCLNCHTDSK
ncbi:MAG: hypothetical protein ACE5FH_11775, partial [Candidatus Zixiibacteriota bacterium]